MLMREVPEFGRILGLPWWAPHPVRIRSRSEPSTWDQLLRAAPGAACGAEFKQCDTATSKQIMRYKEQLDPTLWCLGSMWKIMPFSVKFPCTRFNFECADENLVCWGFFSSRYHHSNTQEKASNLNCVYIHSVVISHSRSQPLIRWLLLSCLCALPGLPFGG